MKFLDENGRIGGKINIVDLIVVVLLVLVIAVIGIRVGSDGDKKNSGVDVSSKTYVVFVEGVRDYSVNSFREGDEVYASEDGTFIGNIIKIETRPMVELHDDGTGTIAEYSVDERKNVLLTIETDAETSEGRTFVNGVFELSRNASIQLKTKYIKCFGRIMEIN